MVHYCCVPQCKSKWKKDGSEKLRFHSFPKNLRKRRQWQIAIRSGKIPTPSMKICSKHFQESDYYSTRVGYQFLKSSSVPSQCLPARLSDRMVKKLPRLVERVSKKSSQLKPDHVNCSIEMPEDPLSFCLEDKEIEVCAEFPHAVGREETCTTTVKDHSELPKCKVVEISSKLNRCKFSLHGNLSKGKISCVFCGSVRQLTNLTGANEHAREDLEGHVVDKSVQTYAVIREGQYISLLNVNAVDLKYFTGLDRDRFDALYFYLMRKPHTFPNCALDAADQLLLTVSKYKLNLDFTLLGTLFKVDRRVVSVIFSYWTIHMYKELKLINLWSLRLKGDDLYTAILDCTEIRTFRSGNPEIHQQLFSNYKNNPTLKGLVAIDELGTVIFCSELFGGSTSDKEMVELSGILSLLERGDIVLADRGFDISDVLEKHAVALNIPPFRRGKGHAQLEESEVMFTRFVAQRRIHIERIIGLGKIHQILVDVMPDHLWEIATPIFFNCMVLCNFKMGIVTPQHFKTENCDK